MADDPRIKNPPQDHPAAPPPPAGEGVTTSSAAPRNEHAAHAREHYDYQTEHTTADPDRVPQGPSESYVPLIVALVAAAIALVAVFFDYMEADTLALVLAIIALVTGIVSIAMGWTDARAGVGAPIFCTIVAAVVLGVVLLDVLDVDERVDPDAVNREMVGDDDGDLSTVESDEIPEDPADIVEGTPEQRDITRD